MRYRVIAECVDSRTDKRYFEGDTFDPAPDPEQAERLLAAGVIVADAKAAKAKPPAKAD